MDIAIWVLSILTVWFFGENYFLKRRAMQVEQKEEQNEIENRLTQLAAERLKIKNDVDRVPLDELINRNRDGSGDNS